MSLPLDPERLGEALNRALCWVDPRSPRNIFVLGFHGLLDAALDFRFL